MSLVSSSAISTAAASAAVAAATITAAAAASATITAAAATIATAAASAAITTAAVSAATAAAITAASVAATAATIATAAATSGFVRFFHGHLLSTDGGIIQRFDCSLCLGLIRHIYKPEAFASSRFPIHHYFCKIHCAIQFEHFFQVHIIEIIGKTCYKKLHADRFKR
jgi:hypothetical protein